jgi:hypothetical protein
MRNIPARPFILTLGALLIIVGAVTLYRGYSVHRASARQAAASKELDRLSAPAPRRDPVSLRPGAR